MSIKIGYGKSAKDEIGKKKKDEIGTTGVVYCGLAKTMWREIRVYQGLSLLNT